MNTWTIHRPNESSTTSAWARWYIGWDCGRLGLGVVREQWGWRIMCLWIHVCYHKEGQRQVNIRHWLIRRQRPGVWRDLATLVGAVVTVLGLAALVAFVAMVVMAGGY